MPFLPPNQQRQSTEGIYQENSDKYKPVDQAAEHAVGSQLEARYQAEVISAG